MKRIFGSGRYANVTATMALVVALGGTSYAAVALPKNSVGSGQLRPGAVAKTDIRANAVTSGKVKNFSLLAKDFKAGQLPAGAKGATGAAGAAGPVGPKGDTGAYPTVLPSGQTLIGAFANIGNNTGNQRIGSAISFPIPLAAAPTAHFVNKGATAPAECPGSAATPRAAPGHLCIYEGVATNVSFQSFEDPVTAATGSTTRVFGVEVVGFSTASGDYQSSGSWAVTAP